MAENHKQKSPTVRYGLDNPHPLSQLKTELVWDGKYDEYAPSPKPRMKQARRKFTV